MAGRKFMVAWWDSVEELRARHRRERDPQLVRPWQALWLLREGRSLGEVAALVGVAYWTLRDWVGWYRAGGLDGFAQHRVGGLRRPIRRPLTPEQETTLVERASTVEFPTRGLALAWLAEQFGVRLTMRQLERVFARRGLRRKVPQPISDRAAPAQEIWKKVKLGLVAGGAHGELWAPSYVARHASAAAFTPVWGAEAARRGRSTCWAGRGGPAAPRSSAR